MEFTFIAENVEANAPTRSECGSTTGSTESELTHYLDRKYWDERSNRVGETDTPKHTTKPLDGMVNTLAFTLLARSVAVPTERSKQVSVEVSVENK